MSKAHDAGLQNQAITNSKSVRGSTERGLAWNASSGALRKALQLVTIASRRGYQLDLSLAACVVIDQDRCPRHELARLLFGYDLGTANAARGKDNAQSCRSSNKRSHASLPSGVLAGSEIAY
jgi:hypothetical protein